jgi:hypothetical protein
MRGSNDSGVAMMSTAATVVDKRRQSWGTTGNGNNGCIKGWWEVGSSVSKGDGGGT